MPKYLRLIHFFSCCLQSKGANSLGEELKSKYFSSLKLSVPIFSLTQKWHSGGPSKRLQEEHRQGQSFSSFLRNNRATRRSNAG